MQIEDLINWMQTLATQYGYVGVFLISLVSATSIFFPIPYTIIIFTLGGTFEPILLGLFAGLGAATGELSGYLLGLGGRKAISEKYRNKMNFLVKIFNRYGPIVIFIFALTPLPDDLIFIPLGVMHYSVFRAFIPAVIGKILMNTLVAYGGRFSINIINEIFGVESTWVSALLGIILAVTLEIIILIVMFKVDWEKRLAKYFEEKDRSTKENHHEAQ